MEAFTPAEGVTTGGDSPGTTESAVESRLTGSLCWEQLDPTGPLLHLERRKEVYSLKKLNQRASGVTIPSHKRQQRQG